MTETENADSLTLECMIILFNQILTPVTLLTLLLTLSILTSFVFQLSQTPPNELQNQWQHTHS